MNEILRFLQVRPVQKISEEEKKFTGLPIYPINSISPLVEALRNAKCEKGKYTEIIKTYKKGGKKSKYISNIKNLHSIIVMMYEWFDYKAKPIKNEQFEHFIQYELLKDLKTLKGFSLKNEWQRIADNFLVRIYEGKINTNDIIDFQILIKVCYILSFLKSIIVDVQSDGDEQSVFVKGGITSITHCFPLGNKGGRVNEILNSPLLLPKDIFDFRCCDEKNIELPKKAVRKKPRPEEHRCKCECNNKCQEASSHCICIKPYIADLLVVKEELSRYEEGDIAYIENILAGEKKKRKHRALFRSEEQSEEETETTSSEERDYQVSKKSSLQSEINKTIQTDLGVDAGVTSTSKYGPNTSITAHGNFAGDYSKSSAEAVSRSYARDVVDRSVSKIQEKIRIFESSKIINELEEKNLHSINNEGGDHRAGIVYWVNKVTNAQIFNHDKHMMFDVYLPEPAALYKKLFALRGEAQKVEPPSPPTKPSIKLEDITRENYDEELKKYDVSGLEDPPLDPFVWRQLSFEAHLDEDANNEINGLDKNIKFESVPDGYKAISCKYQIRAETGHTAGTGPDDEVAILVSVGNHTIFRREFNEHASGQVGGPSGRKTWFSGSLTEPTTTVELDDLEGIISVSVAAFTTLGLILSGTISIKCELKEETFEAWQLKIFKLIMDDYVKKLGASEAQEIPEEELGQIRGRNPFLNREIERNELKRHVISILMCNYFNGIGSMKDQVEDCGYPEINFEKLEKDASVIRFFEQIFEWNYLTYLFYHSMWARKCKWPDLFEEESGDPLFDKFLTAGATRVQVPIREGMEEIFSWFLKTGQIWGASGIPPIFSDDDYVSMIQEIKESRQGDYSERDGEIRATSEPRIVRLTNSYLYWDLNTGQVHMLNLENDIDREILIDFQLYRIVEIVQDAPGVSSTWNITLDKPFEGIQGNSYKHSVGALFVGAPWEVTIPTKLVYLRNETDKLPTYPLN